MTRLANRTVVLRVADWTGRLLLLGAVGLWWGGHVGPQLFSLAFPALLSPDHLLRPLDPELDEGLANTLSAATLLIVGLLAFASAIARWRRTSGMTAPAGWGVLGVVASAIAVSEMSDTHNDAVVAALPLVFGAEAADADWARIALLGPLLAVFALAMWIFGRRGLATPAVRVPFVLGIGAWLLAVAFDSTQPILLNGQDDVLGSVVEEMLELSGALLLGLSAATDLRGNAASRPSPHLFRDRWLKPLLGSMALVIVLGALAFVVAFRVLLIDARATIDHDTLDLRLSAQESVMQELRMPADPVGRIDLQLAHHDPNGRAGTAAIRITEPANPERTLAVGSVEVPVGDRPRWRSIDLLPPLAEAHDQQLQIWVIADITPGTQLQVGVTQADRYPDGGFWINGEPGEAHHDLQFVAYGAAEPTLSKLQAVWQTISSDWRWPVLLLRLAIGLTLITVTPVALIAAAIGGLGREGRSRPGGDSE